MHSMLGIAPARGKCYENTARILLRKTGRIIMKEYIAKAVDVKKFNTGRSKKSDEEIMLSGEATQAQIAAFLTAMRMKGET